MSKKKKTKRVNWQQLGFETYQDYLTAKKSGNLEEEIEKLKFGKERFEPKRKGGRSGGPSAAGLPSYDF